MEGNLALTYSLIYAFLRKQEQAKAAEAVKKAARNIIVLKDDLQLEGPHLDEIVQQWKALQPADSSSESDSPDDTSDDSSSSSNSDSSSSDSSSSSDEAGSSSESDSDGEEGTQSQKEVPVTLPCAERDTSVTLSSDAKAPKVKIRAPPKETSTEESSESESASHKKPIAKAVPKKDDDSSDSESGSSTSGFDSDDSTSESTSNKKPAAKVVPKKGFSGSSSSSDSESTSSSSESESEIESNPSSDKNPIRTSVVFSKSQNAGVKSTPNVETRVTKKRKTSESGAAVVTAVAPIPKSDDVGSFKRKSTQGHGKSKPRPNANERFTRIKPQTIPPEQLLDNGYEAKGGIDNDYGTRAHRDLIVTRGAGFRKEKNKKKRGSYRGGEITMQSHSIKFTD